MCPETSLCTFSSFWQYVHKYCCIRRLSYKIVIQLRHPSEYLFSRGSMLPHSRACTQNVNNTKQDRFKYDLHIELNNVFSLSVHKLLMSISDPKSMAYNT